MSISIENILSDELKSLSISSASVDQYVIYIEVSMMLIIILGRWMMPKKGITRNELSQLLLVYMSIASDVIDLLSILQENAIIQNKAMVYSTLIVYSWSLYQFTLNLVASSSGMKSVEPSLLGTESAMSFTESSDENHRYLILKNEIFNIIINLVMQVGVMQIRSYADVFSF